MKRSRILSLAAGLLGLGALALSLPATGQQPAVPVVEAPPKKYEDFDKVVRGATVVDGLFRLHQKDDHVYAEIRLDQFDRPLLCPIAIARGLGMGGHTLNFDEGWVLVFRKVGDRVQLIRRNVRFQASRNPAVAKAVETTYADSVLLSLRIHSMNLMRMTTLIDLNEIFMQDFAQLGIGMFDSSRSSWSRVKAFPKNIELEVTATYAGFGRGSRAGNSVIDSRGQTVVIHYGLVQMSEFGYTPRLADDRVGHFITVVKDFGSDNRDTAYVRYVNRWRLERSETDNKDPNKPVAPKKKIVYWIEKSVPDEALQHCHDLGHSLGAGLALGLY